MDVLRAGAAEIGRAIARGEACPVEDLCAWRQAGSPAYDGPARKGQAWAGTDRQIRGALMAALRHSKEPLSQPQLVIEVPDSALRDPGQRSRCLAGLIEDGLVEPLPDERYQLPA